jgi:hypothetical protein
VQSIDEASAAFARVEDWIADYFRDTRRYPVLSRSRPGDLVAALPTHAPQDGEPFDAIFDDFERLIIPGITHWNHPRFFAYFAISSGRIAVLAEALAAALDVNAMLWRTSPAATELEDVTLDWLRSGFPTRSTGSSTTPHRSAVSPRSPPRASRSGSTFARAAWPAVPTCPHCGSIFHRTRTRTSRRVRSR